MGKLTMKEARKETWTDGISTRCCEVGGSGVLQKLRGRFGGLKVGTDTNWSQDFKGVENAKRETVTLFWYW